MRLTTWIAAMLMFGCAQAPGEPALLASTGAAHDGGVPGETLADAGTAQGGADAGPADADAGPTNSVDGGPAGSADGGPASSADGGPAGSVDGGPAGSADGGPLGTGSADAGVDRFCDQSVDAAAGIVVTDTGACPGIMPAVPSCAADVTLCGGRGDYAWEATSDAQGAIAVACTVYDSGATFYRLGLAADRYAVTTQLGDEVLPLQSGFVATHRSRPSPVGFFAHDGTQVASVGFGPSAVVVTTAGVEILSASQVAGGWTLLAQLIGPDGVAKGAAQQLGDAAATSGVGMAGAADRGGLVLVTWSTYAPFATYGRWLGPDGTPLSAPFEISAWAGHATTCAALPGGGIAVGEFDNTGTHWRGVLAPGSTLPAQMPAWLATRGEFTLVRGGAAALFGGSEIVAANGASCGAISFADRGSAKAGADGTVFHATADGKTFRLYPQLLR